MLSWPFGPQRLALALTLSTSRPSFQLQRQAGSLSYNVQLSVIYILLPTGTDTGTDFPERHDSGQDRWVCEMETD